MGAFFRVFKSMSETDAYTQNIIGVQNLIESDINKTQENPQEEVGELTDDFALSMSDQELLQLRDEWQRKHDGYYPKIETRAKQNKTYYAGAEYKSGLQAPKGVASNLIFEAQETFIPEALAKNPEPVVWSDNTPEGQQASNAIKAILQYKADTMGLRKKLAVTLRKWSIYFIGIVKHGWNEKNNDFESTVEKPQNFIFDPDAYIDEVGRYIGDFLGQRVSVTAKKLVAKFPKSKSYITLKVDGKMGTRVTYTEWWTDEYCFYTFEDEVLDKTKNWFFNYEKKETNTEDEQLEYGLPPVTVTPGKNHFASPIMPFSFFSVFTLQEQPHDITNLIEQSIPNQDRILDRDLQITRNLRNGNNSIVLSDQNFNIETGKQAANAIEDGDPILGNPDGVKRLPASPLPNGILEAQEVDKDTLRSIFGTKALTPQTPTSNTTARGLILSQDQDSSRIGGGIGESLEQLADNIFNWWLQMMYVFYDEPHYAAVMGQGQSVSYVQIINSDLNRQFVVSVSPNSMAPKDEISEQNQAISLFEAGALDPVSLFTKLNFPDPQETALKVMLYRTNPQAYMQQFLNIAPQAPQGATPQQTGQGGGNIQPEQGTPNPDLTQPPVQEPITQVPLNTQPT